MFTFVYYMGLKLGFFLFFLNFKAKRGVGQRVPKFSLLGRCVWLVGGERDGGDCRTFSKVHLTTNSISTACKLQHERVNRASGVTSLSCVRWVFVVKVRFLLCYHSPQYLRWLQRLRNLWIFFLNVSSKSLGLPLKTLNL